MQRLLFFSRVAFVCNVCFLLTLAMHYAEQMKTGFLTSTIIIIGLVLSLVINSLVNVAYLVVTASGKRVVKHIPACLVIINFLFFVLQAILLIK